MRFNRAVESVGTKTDLKRFAKAYVVDHRRLSEEELRAALIKAGSQYRDTDNVGQAISALSSHPDRDVRVIGLAVLTEVLLNQDEFTCLQRETDQLIREWEQSILDRTDEELAPKRGERIRKIELFRFLLEAAWEDDEVSPDEKHLIEKVRQRLKILTIEQRIIEADIGVFPKLKSKLHSSDEIEKVRRELQEAGLICHVRNDAGDDSDLIPYEVAVALRKILKVELRRYGFEQMLAHRFVRRKDYLVEILERVEFELEGNHLLTELQSLCMDLVTPTEILSGPEGHPGLSKDDLKIWCAELDAKVSGTKEELVERIIAFYDNLLSKPKEDTVDPRKESFEFYVEFANRDLPFLRSQLLIDKDLDCEKRFEEGTHYLFEKMLGHKPLPNVGTERADGFLPDGNNIILWDNKSKESACSLKHHIEQFARYIRNSEKTVSAFLVIAPSFTGDSEATAIAFEIESEIPIALIEAKELKWVAQKWAEANKGKDFPIGYLCQGGRLKTGVVQSLF